MSGSVGPTLAGDTLASVLLIPEAHTAEMMPQTLLGIQGPPLGTRDKTHLTHTQAYNHPRIHIWASEHCHIPTSITLGPAPLPTWAGQHGDTPALRQGRVPKTHDSREEDFGRSSSKAPEGREEAPGAPGCHPLFAPGGSLLHRGRPEVMPPIPQHTHKFHRPGSPHFSLTTGEDIRQPGQSQIGGCTCRIPLDISVFRLFPARRAEAGRVRERAAQPEPARAGTLPGVVSCKAGPLPASVRTPTCVRLPNPPPSPAARRGDLQSSETDEGRPPPPSSRAPPTPSGPREPGRRRRKVEPSAGEPRRQDLGLRLTLQREEDGHRGAANPKSSDTGSPTF